MHVVALYEQALAYGGPEEGGWWYDSGTLCRLIGQFVEEQAAHDYCRRLNTRLQSRRFGPNKGRPAYSSVSARATYFAHVYEDAAPAAFPARRPHYE